MIKRSYKAKAIRRHNDTAIGAIEYNGKGESLAIYSLYFPRQLSHLETFGALITSLNMDPSDEVTVRVNDMRVRYEWAKRYGVYVRRERGDGKAFNEPAALAKDALYRRSSIVEQFDEPLTGGV